MKKMMSLLAAMALVLTLAGCSSNQDDEINDTKNDTTVVEQEKVKTPSTEETTEGQGLGGNMQIANPWLNFETIDEAFASAGVSMNVPETIGTYTISEYRAMPNEMLEIIYQDGDNMIHLRKAKGNEDISGHYGSDDYEVSSVNYIGTKENTVYLKDNLIYVATWTTEDETFSLTSDTGLTNEEFTSVLNTILLTVE